VSVSVTSNKRGWPLAILGAATLLAISGLRPAHAEGNFLEAGASSLPPIGWVQFCQSNRTDCAVPMSDAVIEKGSVAWAQLRKINNDVNRRIAPVTDEEHWGMVERWSYPTDGAGDCEDYVLEKRRLLMEAGVPAGTLMIAVVLDKEGLGHAVLLARTSIGDLVLDNQEPRVLHWRDTGYTFLKRQDNQQANRWVSLNKRHGARDNKVGAATP
jgi:predicted transglutaminase-like cysteine proteinase